MNSLPLKCCLLLATLSMGFWLAPQVSAQWPINAADSARVGQVLDSPPSPDSFDCSIQPQDPVLNYTLSFDIGFIVSCAQSLSGGMGHWIDVSTRITPEGGQPVVLGHALVLPRYTQTLKGKIPAGKGRDQVEVLAQDRETGWTARKRWSVDVPAVSSQLRSALVIPPNSVGAIPTVTSHLSSIKLDTSKNGLHVTVLVDATSLKFDRLAALHNPALLGWDRGFLTNAISLTLRQVPCASVRLRAFNLDHEEEVLSQDQFDADGFAQISRAVHGGGGPPGTVSAHRLQVQQQKGGLGMLVDYVNKELAAIHPSDAVIILGPQSTYSEKASPRSLKGLGTRPLPFYYFEYSPGLRRKRSRVTPGGAETKPGVPSDTPRRSDTQLLPDSLIGLPETEVMTDGCPNHDEICVLTQRLGGTAYRYSSAGELALSIEKMLARLQPGANTSATGTP